MKSIIDIFTRAAQPAHLGYAGNCKYGDVSFDRDVFAELIINECAKVADANAHVGVSVGSLIRQRFNLEPKLIWCWTCGAMVSGTCQSTDTTNCKLKENNAER